MGFLKVAGSIVVIIVMLIVLFFALIGFGVFSLGKSMADAANGDVNQTVYLKDGKAVIEVPLKENFGIMYENIKLCKNDTKKGLSDISSGGFSAYEGKGWRSYIDSDIGSKAIACSNGLCKVTLFLDNSKIVPEYLYIYVKSNQECKRTKFETAGHIIPIDYSATIEFTDKLIELAKIDNSKKYTPSCKNSTDISTYQFFGTKKLKVSYPEKREYDKLLVDEKVVADIVYK